MFYWTESQRLRWLVIISINTSQILKRLLCDSLLALGNPVTKGYWSVASVCRNPNEAQHLVSRGPICARKDSHAVTTSLILDTRQDWWMLGDVNHWSLIAMWPLCCFLTCDWDPARSVAASRRDELNPDMPCCSELLHTCGLPVSHLPLTFITAKVFLPALVEPTAHFPLLYRTKIPRGQLFLRRWDNNLWHWNNQSKLFSLSIMTALKCGLTANEPLDLVYRESYWFAVCRTWLFCFSEQVYLIKSPPAECVMKEWVEMMDGHWKLENPWVSNIAMGKKVWKDTAKVNQCKLLTGLISSTQRVHCDSNPVT